MKTFWCKRVRISKAYERLIKTKKYQLSKNRKKKKNIGQKTDNKQLKKLIAAPTFSLFFLPYLAIFQANF